ncbi:ABC transporter [Microbacterium mangrovi]|uniref:ABC transporter n=1 Tax=Microbacterium mangrovi TaxID=1348253 RepID=A0A0B2A8G2_9MICO|nr:ABC transporter [Microbacterium mangrovi]
MTFRPGPLRAAAGLAAFFVVARVAYRVLFNGATGTGIVLLPLPAIPLPAPFTWVVLLGPVTVDGLWDAAWSAVPVASVILLFGLVNSLVDVSRGFARLARRGPLHGIARALAVAWSTLPALGQAVRTVHTAQRLRGEKPGPRLLVPVLERTLERASAVANGLELRGFGGSPRDGACERPVAVTDAAFGFGDRTVVRVADLTLPAGSLTVLTGPTGSGKSTLLRALAGLLDHVDGGWSHGSVEVVGHDRRRMPPRDASRLIGVVLQNPREGFCSELVGDEIGLALQLRGVAPAIVAARVGEVAARMGLTPLLSRSVHSLSAGEATLVAIAAAVVEHPILLLVDEPLADLDAAARVRVVAVLESLAHAAGVCVVVAEHRAAPLADAADAWWRIDAGALASAHAPARTPDPFRGERGETRLRAPEGSVPALAASRIRVVHGAVIAVHDASIELAPGEIVALVGPNGAGKSSLLTAIALPARGAEITGRAVLVPDASDDLFTQDTVAAECARADRLSRRAGTPGAVPAADRFATILGLDAGGRADRMPRHPRDLSLGERRCLAIALQLTRSPDALMIDEPTRGLDAAARGEVAVALCQAADAGTAVLLATHDVDFAAALGARILPMCDGVVPAPPRRVVEQAAGAGSTYRTQDEPAPSPVPAAMAPRNPRVAAPRRRNGPAFGTPSPARPWLLTAALVAANLVALAAFTWPLGAAALPAQANAAAPWAALALAPVAVVVAVAALDGAVRSAHTLAYLGVLAAIGTAVRIASAGVGGVEAVFILLVLAGRAFGARFGMLLGVATIALSSTMFGGLGPWTPFQMFACAWVGAGAGLLPRKVRGWAEIGMLCVYGALASYAFGLIMNLWFWPFAIGSGSGISYVPGAPFGQNAASFLLYSLVTSTLTWDTLRAVTTIVGVVVIGRPVLAALRRAKPVAAGRPASSAAPASGIASSNPVPLS